MPAGHDKVRRTLELVYGIEGVIGARVWDFNGTYAVGVRPSPHASTPLMILQRVERVLQPLRDPGEVWELGLLEDAD